MNITSHLHLRRRRTDRGVATRRGCFATRVLPRLAIPALTSLGLGVATMALSSTADAALVRTCGGSTYGRVLVSGTAWSGLSASNGDLNVYDNAACFPHNWESVGTYGLQWQCTELAARWADVAWGEGGYQNWLAAGWSGSAQDMWRVAPLLRVPLTRYANGGPVAPQKGDLLVISDAQVGHVAIITGVSGGRLNFVGENQGRAGGASWIPISGTTANSSAWLTGSTVLGWLRGSSSPFSMPFAYRLDGVTTQNTAGGQVDLSHAWIGERATMAVTVTNTGTSVWDSNVRVGVPPQSTANLTDPGWLSQVRPAAVVGTVAPNSSYTFRFPITVGAASAPFIERFNLVDELVTWFPDQGIRAAVSFQQIGGFGVVTRHLGVGGYQLAPDGAVTAFGGAPALANSAALWPGWNIARGLVLRSDDTGGYILDGFGGLHGFGS